MRPTTLLMALAAALAPTAALPDVDCYCTDGRGGRAELGETLCLTVGGRSFRARCEMSQNVPMWRDIEQPCLMG